MRNMNTIAKIMRPINLKTICYRKNIYNACMGTIWEYLCLSSGAIWILPRYIFSTNFIAISQKLCS